MGKINKIVHISMHLQMQRPFLLGIYFILPACVMIRLLLVLTPSGIHTKRCNIYRVTYNHYFPHPFFSQQWPLDSYSSKTLVINQRWFLLSWGYLVMPKDIFFFFFFWHLVGIDQGCSNPTMQRTAPSHPQQRITRPKMSTKWRLRNSAQKLLHSYSKTYK